MGEGVPYKGNDVQHDRANKSVPQENAFASGAGRHTSLSLMNSSHDWRIAPHCEIARFLPKQGTTWSDQFPFFHQSKSSIPRQQVGLSNRFVKAIHNVVFVSFHHKPPSMIHNKRTFDDSTVPVEYEQNNLIRHPDSVIQIE